MSRHRCHAKGCDAECPPRHLMCYRHWRALPEDLKDLVRRRYEPGQEVKKNPTSAYLAAIYVAIAWTALEEGRTAEARQLIGWARRRAARAGPDLARATDPHLAELEVRAGVTTPTGGPGVAPPETT